MTATESETPAVAAPAAPAAAPRKRPAPRTPHPLLEVLFQHHPQLFGARFLPLSTLENHYLNRHIREMMIELLNNTELHLTHLTSVEK